MGMLDKIKTLFRSPAPADAAAEAERKHLEDARLDIRTSQARGPSTITPTPAVTDPDRPERH